MGCCRINKFLPGAKVIGKFKLRDDTIDHHIEDSEYSGLKFNGFSTPDELKAVLEKTLSSSVEKEFGEGVMVRAGCNNQYYLKDNERFERSIVTIKACEPQISEYTPYKPNAKNQLRIRFTDSNEKNYLLPLKDARFDIEDDLDKINEFILKQENIYLRIGLNGPFSPGETYSLQVNGIYCFPDWPRQLLKYA